MLITSDAGELHWNGQHFVATVDRGAAVTLSAQPLFTPA
jgi:hypothetical protein